MSSNDALYQLMRFNLMAFALTEIGKKAIDDAYAAAWSNGVYPILHNNDWHKPFANEFRVNKERMEELATYLDASWRKNDVPSFNRLETELGSKGWRRSDLVSACNYLCLYAFDDEFRSALFKDQPSEASDIGGEPDRVTQLIRFA
jgi:hypothetical protein